MTVIAYDGRILAADGRITADSTLISDNYVKLREVMVKDLGKCIVGVAGECGIIGPYLEHLQKEGLKPFDTSAIGCDRNSTLRGLLITSKGKCIEFECDGSWYEMTAPTAIGSGCHIAQHYLTLGVDAVTSVTNACKTELSCGGVITTYDTKTKVWGEIDP